MQILARLSVLALLLLGACATDQPSAVINLRPASLALRATVAADASSLAQVRVSVFYLRQGGSVVALGGPQLITLDKATQQVPVSVDVATCLADGSRAGTGGNAPASDECNVQLTLEFLLNSVRVDQQVLTNVSVKPGQTATVTQPVALAQVGDVRLMLPAANTQGDQLRLERGKSLTLGVQVTDANNAPITGRAVSWVSSNPAVATVSSSGVVTGIAIGGTRITGDVAGREVSVTTNVTIPSQTITIASTGTSGRGQVRSTPAGIDCSVQGGVATGSCAVDFPGDVTVQLQATAGTSSDFLTFAGDCTAVQGAQCTVTPTAARRVTVAFRGRQSLTVASGSTGSGTVVATSGAIACTVFGQTTNGACADNYAEGAAVTLTATPTGGSTFLGWSGDCVTTNGLTCAVTMDKARTVSARFASNAAVLVRGAGTGNGTVTTQPNGVNCTVLGSSTEGSCTGTFVTGSSVTATAVAREGSEFIGWSGPCTGNGACTFTIEQTTQLSANFRLTGVPLTIQLTGPSGTSVNTSIGSSCAGSGSSCTFFVTPGTTVRLTADQGAYRVFTGFTGSCTTTGPCDVVMSEPRTVTANFTSRQATMWLVLSGSGAGTVTNSSGSSCTLAAGQGSRSCSTVIEAGTPVTFSPQALAGSQFTAFGGSCSGTGACSVNADNLTISGGFRTLPTIVRVVRASGTGGSGQVVFGSENNRCNITLTGTSGACAVEVLPGASMTFTIDPSVGFPFVSWGGACASFGTNPVCSISVAGSVDVTAKFQAPPQ